MSDEKRDFSKDAASWDASPRHQMMAEKVFGAIVNRIILSTEMDVLDFGCGTGLLSMRLLPFVRSVVGVDSSAGMIEVFRKKMLTAGVAGISARLIDPDDRGAISGSYDLVTSSMTLHHIKDPLPLLTRFYSVLKPGGKICIADLDSDDGMFHENTAGVFHNGFGRAALKALLAEAGFAAFTDDTATEIEKPDAEGTVRKFSIFLMTGTKSA